MDRLNVVADRTVRPALRYSELFNEYVPYFFEFLDDFGFPRFDVEIVLVLLMGFCKVVVPDVVVAEEAFGCILSVVAN